MGQRNNLTWGFISNEIKSYGVHGNTLQKIIDLVKASNIAYDEEELEDIILECCASWCSMVTYGNPHEKKWNVVQVVTTVLNRRLEERFNVALERYDDGVYYDEDDRKDFPLVLYRDGYFCSQPNWRRK